MKQNRARYGGGLYISDSFNLKIVNLTIFNGTAYKSGGGIYMYGVNDSEINSIQILNNWGLYDGGMFLDQMTNFFLRNTEISKNWARY